MRRVNPSLFRQRQIFTRASTYLIKPNSAQSSIPLRHLSSSSVSLFPRSGPRNRYSNAIAENDDEPEEWEDDNSPEFVEIDSDPTLPYSSTPPDLPPSKSFEALACTLYPAPSTPDTSPIPDYLQPLHGNLLTTFLPANQPLQTLAPVPQHGIAKMHGKPVAIGGPMGMQMMPIDIGDMGSHGDQDGHDGEGSANGAKEAVLALVSPFEGGGHYVLDAVKKVAGRIDSEVLTLDLTLGLGFDGVAAPLAGTGLTAPELSSSLNPLLQALAKPASPPPSPFGNGIMEDDGNEDGDEESDSAPRAATFVMPLPGRMVGLHNLNSSPFGGQGPRGGVRGEWVAFFEKLLNRTVEGEESEVEEEVLGTPKRRIVVLSGAEAMSGTFDIWWPSFVEAVRQYRRGPVIPPAPSGRKKASTPIPQATLSRPITIVLNSSPSLLLSHAGPVMSLNKEDAGEEEVGKGLHPMLQALAERFGGSVEAKIDEGESVPLWWGSEELDVAGREQREQRRLSAILDNDKGAMALLPTFGSKAGAGNKSPSHLPMLQALMSLSRPTSNTDKQSQTPSIVWKAIPIIPNERNLPREMLERITNRSLVSAALVARAIAQLGGKLVDPVSAMYHLDVTPVGRTKGTRANTAKQDRTMRVYTDEQEALEGQIAKLISGRQYRLKKDGWQNMVKSWSKMQALAETTVGRILARGEGEAKDAPEEVSVRWEDVLAAAKAEKVQENLLDEQIKRHLPKQSSSSTTATEDKPSAEPTPTPSAGDLVIKRVKKAKDLSSHEKRLLGSIVDTTKIASTTFQEVHLPFKTIDAVRTVVSLPLLFPEAFLGGVLKDHSTTGALLFGPPGTGKTLLARAVANDSGARMLAIQPSDVNDKYFGEGEKLVKAVFSLARRLSPCVVFIDEIDSLFGARSSRGSGSGHKAHDQLLTEFMQEMDGLSSAAANKEKRIVVVGATNRPFDLDDAVLRRLPRRLLVDLPGEEDRKAILNILLKGENLGGDVDLQKLAKDTEGFSGSDLKHLCVSAALSAVKDMVKVPWQTSLNATPSSSAPSAPAAESGGMAPKEDLVIIPKVVEQVAKPEVIEPVTSGDAGGVTQLIAGKLVGEAGSEAETASQKDWSKSPGNLDEAVDEQQDGTGIGADEAAKEKQEETKDTKPKRILSRKHFDVALVEIRPSSTEEGTLPELRKWAEQYGEGGSQRGRKKGFGKGFGFSDPDSKSTRESGFGKVAQDD